MPDKKLGAKLRIYAMLFRIQEIESLNRIIWLKKHKEPEVLKIEATVFDKTIMKSENFIINKPSNPREIFNQKNRKWNK